MKRFLSAVSLFLMSCWAFAATREMEGANAPVETVDVVYVVIFVVIFVASIIGFFIYLYINDKKQKPDQ
jgi:heme/copper-type cytochrome/quinol oxidase subunit 2